MVTGQHTACPAQSCLDLIADEQNIGIPAKLRDLAEVTFIRYYHTRLTLDGLYKEAGHVGIFQCLLEGRDIVVGYDDEPGHIGTEPVIRLGIRAERDHCAGPAVEIAGADDDLCLVVGNAFDLVAPAAAKLDGRLDSLDASVHGKHLVITK